MSESLLKDDLIITPFSPDNDEVLRQFRKGIKIFKPLQLSITPFSYAQKQSIRTLSPKEEKLEMDQPKAENTIKKPDDNPNDDVLFDKSGVNYQKQSKEQNKNTYESEKIKNRSFIRPSTSRKNTISSSSSSNSLPSSPISPNSPTLSIKKSKKSSKNVVMNNGTIMPSYAITHPKRNKDFHNTFKEIPHDEHLINEYNCALQKEILFQGRIFVSQHYICFNSIFYWSTNVVISFSDIKAIEKKMTAFVIPNAIQITTENTKYFFASLLSRDSLYELLMNLWKDDSIPRNVTSNHDNSNEVNEKGSESTGTQSPMNLQEIIHHETVCDCLKNKQHFDNVVLDTKFKISVEKIYNLLYTSGFIAKFLSKIEQNDGPKTANCCTKDEILHQNFDKYVTVMSSAETQDVPSGSGFTVKTRTCIIRADSNMTRVIVTSTVEFSKHTLSKSTIKKSSLEGRLASLEIILSEYISKHLSEFNHEINDKTERDEDINNVQSSIKQSRKIYLNENKTKKLRILKLNMETILQIALLLTLIANVYISICLSNIDANIRFIEGQSKEVKVKSYRKVMTTDFDQNFPLDDWLNKFRERQLISILDDENFDE